MTMLADTGAALGFLERALAVVGGAALGGLLAGLGARLLVKLVSGQQTPRWVLMVVRLLGAVIAGWLVAMLVFGTGGGGWGFGRGGSGDGKGQGTGSGQATTPAVPTPPQTDPGRTVAEGSLLRIDVLGEKAAGQAAFKESRCFRLPGGREVIGPDDLKKHLLAQKRDNPKLETVELVTASPDPPDSTSHLIRGLRQWGDENHLKIKVGWD